MNGKLKGTQIQLMEAEVAADGPTWSSLLVHTLGAYRRFLRRQSNARKSYEGFVATVLEPLLLLRHDLKTVPPIVEQARSAWLTPSEKAQQRGFAWRVVPHLYFVFNICCAVSSTGPCSRCESVPRARPIVCIMQWRVVCSEWRAPSVAGLV